MPGSAPSGIAMIADPQGLVGRAAPRHEATKLTSLSLGIERDGRIERSLAEMERLPFVDSILALPDVHQKERMEIPSSIAVTTRDVLVPEFTSVAVNDGMGVVATDLDAAALTPERLRALLSRIGSNAAAGPFDGNRYSISSDELRRILHEGAHGVLERYGFPEQILEHLEDGGVIHDASRAAIEEIVPFQLLLTRFSRSEMGLNFGGNHFLEVQVVDEVLDPAASFGLTKGQVVVMYHLGPGPFSGTLLHHYSRRTKLSAARVPLFFLSKLLFHYGQRLGRSNPVRAWGMHFRHNRWTPYPVDSTEGRAFRSALAMAINFGYAYRLATVRAILDGVSEAISARARGTLVCDIPHNGITRETWNGVTGWIARHNACRLAPGGPSIVAGSYDVPSYLGLGGSGGPDVVHSYDHGAGNLIEHYRAHDRLPATGGTVTRIRMSRGRNAEVLRSGEVPLRSREPIDQVMDCLERHDVVRPTVRLRPLGNFKN